MKISDKLQAFIEHQWNQVDEIGLERKRKQDKKRRDRDRKGRERLLDSDLKKLSNMKHLPLDVARYQYYEKRIKAYHDEIKRSVLAKEGSASQNPLKSKATLDLNVFIYCCYYFIKRDNPDLEADIHRWIEKFLKEKDHKMKNGKSYYDASAIKTRIRNFKKMDTETRKSIEDFLEHCHNSFTSKNL